jgi:hypothetical protein
LLVSHSINVLYSLILSLAVVSQTTIGIVITHTSQPSVFMAVISACKLVQASEAVNGIVAPVFKSFTQINNVAMFFSHTTLCGVKSVANLAVTSSIVSHHTQELIVVIQLLVQNKSEYLSAGLTIKLPAVLLSHKQTIFKSVFTDLPFSHHILIAFESIIIQLVIIINIILNLKTSSIHQLLFLLKKVIQIVHYLLNSHL